MLQASPSVDASPKRASPCLDRLMVKLFADGADKTEMLALYRNSHIKGFTTNPTLMRQAGVSDYRAFAEDILDVIVDRPISFEIFADDEAEMERQAREIARWGRNVYVKVPVTDTRAASTARLVRRLASDGIQLNVTALMTLEQVEETALALADGAPAFVSVFAGRIADTGRDPVPLMREALQILAPFEQVELIWASPRELLNVFHADEIHCHIITVTSGILSKLGTVGKDLTDYSLDTVRMFHRDAVSAGFAL